MSMPLTIVEGEKWSFAWCGSLRRWPGGARHRLERGFAGSQEGVGRGLEK